MQYYKLQDGSMWQVNSQGVASRVSAIPAGGATISWNAAGAPPGLQNAPGYGSNPLPPSSTPAANNGITVTGGTVTHSNPAPAQAQNTPPPPQAAQPPSVNLQPGSTDSASVKQLQDWLVSQHYMTQDQVNTGYGTYGPQTTAAVQKYQQDHGVDNSSGPGYWGPLTRAAATSASQPNSSSTVYGSNAQSTLYDANGNYIGPAGGGSGVDTSNIGGQGKGTGLVGVANNLISTGYTIPDTLKITPDLVSQFLNYAHQAVDPQTQQMIQNEAANINASLANMTTQFQNQEGQIVQDFGTTLATNANNAGANGVAFSGQRNLGDLNLAASTNRALSNNESQTGYNIGALLRQGGADVGSANAGAFNVPGLSGTTVGLTGGARGNSGAGTGINFNYNPSAYTVGTIPTNQNTAVNNLASNYQSQYSTLAANNSNGSKSINDLLGMMTGLPANRQPYSGGGTTSNLM